jgi:hypothetical protein
MASFAPRRRWRRLARVSSTADDARGVARVTLRRADGSDVDGP